MKKIKMPNLIIVKTLKEMMFQEILIFIIYGLNYNQNPSEKKSEWIKKELKKN